MVRLSWTFALLINTGLLGLVALAQSDGSTELADHVVETVPEGDFVGALKTFIEFSEQHGLGLHLGTEKGNLLEASVRQGLPPHGPAVVFEAGCHAGDGTLNAVAAVSGRLGSTIISTEGSKRWLGAAERVVGHAVRGRSLKFLPLHLGDQDDFDAFLDKLRKEHSIKIFDAVVFDHDEKLFLPHLRLILEKRMLRVGGTVYVDNVKRKHSQLRKYLEFVNTKAKNGFVTELKSVQKPYSDAVAISTYVGPNGEL